MPTINVELGEDLYRKLKAMKAEAGPLTWQEFFKKIVSKEVEIYMEILSIDGKPPSDHSVDFKLGQYVYRFQNGDMTLLSNGKRSKIVVINGGKTT